jgi:ribosomal-protein-alanine N-acetyltransferase
VVTLESPTIRCEREFLAAVRRSRELHGNWVSPPATSPRYRDYVRRSRQNDFIAHLVRTTAGDLAGVINISEIVRGKFQSGYLGFYAFVPHAGCGIMRTGMALAVTHAFRRCRLHRLEANIQPDNERSIELVKGLGFRLEGRSPRYLKIAGRWRDHERWALTAEDVLMPARTY